MVVVNQKCAVRAACARCLGQLPVQHGPDFATRSSAPVSVQVRSEMGWLTGIVVLPPVACPARQSVDAVEGADSSQPSTRATTRLATISSANVHHRSLHA